MAAANKFTDSVNPLDGEVGSANRLSSDNATCVATLLAALVAGSAV